MLIKIVSHFDSSKVLFEGDFDSIRLCLEAAVKKGAYLRGSDLSYSDLSGSDLIGSNLSGSDLSYSDLIGSNLSGSDLRGSNLRGANFDIEPVSTEQAIKNLDVVGEIILDKADRLEMGHWHKTNDWVKRTCIEEAQCGTTHCLAGWLQICSTDGKIRNLSPALAGTLLAPIASHMFYKTNDEVLTWLRNRDYAKETS